MAEINRAEDGLTSSEEERDPYAPPEDGQEFKLTPEEEAVAPPEEEKRKEKSASEREADLAAVREEMYRDKEYRTLGVTSRTKELEIEGGAWDAIEKAKKEGREAKLSRIQNLILNLKKKEKNIELQMFNEQEAARKLEEELKEEKIKKLEDKIGEI